MLDKIIKGFFQLLLAGALLVFGFFAFMHFMNPSTPNIPPQQVQQPAIQPQSTPNVYPSEQPTPIPAVTPDSDTIKYDPAKKMKDEAMDQTLTNAHICSRRIVEAKLASGSRSRKDIGDYALLICGREMADRSRIFGLGLKVEQIEAVITAEVDDAIKISTH